MILLQASICLSAGVASLVHSGPSSVRACAPACCGASAAHKAAVTSAALTLQRCIRSSPRAWLRLSGCVAAARRLVQALLPSGTVSGLDGASADAVIDKSVGGHLLGAIDV